jgi:hypothetical protein
VSSRARLTCVDDELPVDHIGQSAFERPQGFHLRFAGRDPAPEVCPAFGVVADLDDRHDVQRPVDATVASPGQPMAFLRAG